MAKELILPIVLRVYNTPIPQLYSAGELGSICSMLYQDAGNLGGCIVFGQPPKPQVGYTMLPTM